MYKKIEMILKEKGISGYRLCKDIGISKSSLADWIERPIQNDALFNGAWVVDFISLFRAHSRVLIFSFLICRPNLQFSFKKQSVERPTQKGASFNEVVAINIPEVAFQK